MLEFAITFIVVTIAFRYLVADLVIDLWFEKDYISSISIAVGTLIACVVLGMSIAATVKVAML